MGCDRTFDQGDPRLGVGVRGDAQAGGVTTPPLTYKDARLRAFFFAIASLPAANAKRLCKGASLTTCPP
jgi:hypothetical protein